MVQIWALIVGIDTYAHEDWNNPPPSGADVDVQRTQQYLLEDLSVPSQNIIILQNKEATRQSIIETFTSHLVENRGIQDGDAILFHFSGHGSRCEAPDGWPVIDKKNGQPGAIEMIIPYDESIPDGDGYPICGIPDRTLAALLAKVTKKYGENVTVVLDCCHSGHGTRGVAENGELVYSVRGIDSKKVTPIRKDVDRGIWEPLNRIGGIGERSRGGFTVQRAKSHVLIAACGQDEYALGNKKDGGILTSLWLRALRDENIQPRSYSHLMKAVSNEVEKIRSKHEIVRQHPQCEGITRDRVVFQNTNLDLQFFEVKRGGTKSCRIMAGEVQGVKVGTTFELYEVNLHSTKGGRTLGTAVALYVDPTTCIAEVSESLRLSGEIHSARILGRINPLRFAISNSEPDSPDALKTIETIEKSLSKMSFEIACVLQRVQDHTQAELVLAVDGQNGGGVTLRRRDAILADLKTRSPRLDSDDVEDADFANLLNSIARFNTYLAQSSQTHPFAEVVDLRFHLLQPDPDLDFLSDAPLTEARVLLQEIQPKNQEELEIKQADSDDYAFVLENNSSTALYVYLMYFDTGTYEISLWYSPANPSIPTLLPHRELQIGASPEHADPFSFFIRRGDDVDTSFIKVFVLESPTQMMFMEQRPQMGRDENGRRYMRFKRANDTVPGVKTPPRRGGWDCITRKINVLRKDGN